MRPSLLIAQEFRQRLEEGRRGLSNGGVIPGLGAMPRQVGVTAEIARSDNNSVSAFAERTGDFKSRWKVAEHEDGDHLRTYDNFLAAEPLAEPIIRR